MGMESKGKDLIGELERLSALRDQGHLTDAEFAAAKQKLLGGGSAPEGVDVSDETYEYHTVSACSRQGAVIYPPASAALDDIRNQMAEAGWQYVREQGGTYMETRTPNCFSVAPAVPAPSHPL